jgi:hypothetical protein
VIVARVQGLETVEGSTAVSVQQEVASLAFIRGAGQEGRVGEPLPVAPAVRLLDPLGNPVSGVRVAFQVMSGGGRVSFGSRPSDSSGEASPGDWVMGGTLGVQELRAEVSGGSSALLQARAVTGRPARLVALSPLEQDGEAGRDVSEPPAVRVEDEGGNPVAGVTVQFGVVAGGGTLTPSSVRTGADGVAGSTRWRLGLALGRHLADASVDGLPVMRFSVDVVAGEPAAVVVTEGDGQSAVVNSNVAVAPRVRVTDSGGNPLSGIPVTFTVASGGGSITGDMVVTDVDGFARVGSWQLGTVAGANTLDAAVAGGISTTVTATGVPGPASAPHSTLSVTAHASGDSTVVATLTVRDAWGNVRTAGGDSPLVTGPLGAAAVTDQGDGTYESLVALEASSLWEVLIPLVSELDPMLGTEENITVTPVRWQASEGVAAAPYQVDVSATLGGIQVAGSPHATTVVPANFPAFRVVSWWLRAEAWFTLPQVQQLDVLPPGESFARVEHTVTMSQQSGIRRLTTETIGGVEYQGGVLTLDIAGTHAAEDADEGGFFRSGMRVNVRSFRALESEGSVGCFIQVLPGSSYWRARTAVTRAFVTVVDEWLVDSAAPGTLGDCP